MFYKNLFYNEKFNLCFVAFAASLVMLPVFLNGLPYGYDMTHHFQCAFTFYESLLNGDFYPSWSAARNAGYGGMELRLYPPISHYALALFNLLANDWHIALWLVLTFFSIVGSFGIYLWARELMSTPQAVFAACIYAFLPYHLTQVYNTFFYAEYAGSAVLPFCFAFVARVCRRGKVSDIFGLALTYAALILTHLPLTVIGSVCLGIYAIAFFRRENLVSAFNRLAAAVLIALAGTSFFWTKVLQERDLLAKTNVYPDPWLDYRLHFLFTPIQSFEGLHLDIYQNSLFFYDLMFLCATVLVFSCALPFVFATEPRKNLSGVWLVFAAAAFFATPLSQFVWNNLEFLQEVQFPWRWLTLVSIAASVLSASYLDLLVEWFRGKKRPLALIVCGSILAVVTFSVSQIIRPAPFIEKSTVAEWIENTKKIEGFTFWWTPWARKEIFDVKKKVFAEDREVAIDKWTAIERKFQIAAGSASEVRIATFYHPNWQVTVNGAEQKITPDENGAILITAPREDLTVILTFHESIAVEIGRRLSVIVWLSFLLFGILKAIKSNAFVRLKGLHLNSYLFQNKH